MNYYKATAVLGSVMLTMGLSQLLPNGMWLWLLMVIAGTAIVTVSCMAE
ncbi:hypothetical protein UFOVP26_55 [uncultured Caudovirales phage]|uniref:Uncharacterized protein n=1 Tax=uncultured Caudovirales phage TaxID=2100421 RepID=A0A6J5KL11_9CAUD|nr:hypothetical protein UFOVP26_55 [uncultured Caudovirales phage]CAB4123723.1 hypothetical protein UFOVP44_42 [uncultured Caudovirales phage]CAB5219107.1 hypothetical protein UFOVP220_33 [uncultured Caudovirales phage]